MKRNTTSTDSRISADTALEPHTTLYPHNIDWLNYYSQCRESYHQYGQKALSLIFQFTSFTLAGLTLVAVLYEKVDHLLALALAATMLPGLLYFLSMTVRFFYIVRITSRICRDIEQELFFGPELAPKYGILSAVVAYKAGFFSSDRMLLVVRLYCAVLTIATIAVCASLLISCRADLVSAVHKFLQLLKDAGAWLHSHFP